MQVHNDEPLPAFPTLAEVDECAKAYSTREEYLLHVSDEDEIRRHPHKERTMSRLAGAPLARSRSLSQRVIAGVGAVYEYAATGVRFVHLVVIFVPVVVGSVAIFFGRRLAEADNERTGALWWYRLLVHQMERAGPTFIKLGQWAASRTDIFSQMMCEEMSKLHSNVQAHGFDYTRRTIEAAFPGRTLDQIFEEFNPTPLGVGAIAQVYQGRLAADLAELEAADVSTSFRKNRIVAVKVLHPRVEPMVYRDLAIMRFGATLLHYIPTIEWLSLPDEVDKFSEMMRMQMDLRIESTNLQIFQRNFGERDGVHFPQVPFSLQSPRVLFEEYVSAVPINKILHMPAASRIDMEREIADMGLDAFLKMLLIDNFVHADLHPGNIMVRFVRRNRHRFLMDHLRKPAPPTPEEEQAHAAAALEVQDIVARLMAIEDPAAFRRELQTLDNRGFRPQVVFLDAGLVTELSDVNRRNFIDLFTALAEFKGYEAGELMIQRSRTPETVVDAEKFALRMQKLILDVKAKTFRLGNVRIGDILTEALQMVRVHHVRMEGDFVNVVISILLLEGIGRQLDPNIDIFRSALPILRRLGTQGAQGGAQVLQDQSVLQILKVWAALEARQFVTGSAQDMVRLVRLDQLCPNY
ncbi:ABC1 family-domain-containing protein [Dipodascopsis tothii]|uniref:ABC1 family-domain-containing protein n=1 Tax=Dipodascopsis tothii TaxID=44089 RepID=UPI0034CEF062